MANFARTPIPPMHPAIAMARLSFFSAQQAARDIANAKAQRQIAALRRRAPSDRPASGDRQA